MIYTKQEFSREEWIDFVNEDKGPAERWQEDWVESARDRVHNLDMSKPEDQEIFYMHLRTHIMFNEILWKDYEQGKNNRGETCLIPKTPIINHTVYEDTKDLKTIGIGFNMMRPEAKAEWEGAFGDEISFDEALDGGGKLTSTQAYQLLDYSISIREKELKRKLGEIWDLLKPNEKISIISMYYNSRKLIGKNFTKNIKEYVKTGDEKYLKLAFEEAKYYSNPKKDSQGKTKPLRERVGVQRRMDREALMLESYKCPLYSRPGEEPIPEGAKISAVVGKTVIPDVGEVDLNDTDDLGKKKKYYIWRTKNDYKVRPKHEFFEGEIFSIDEPPYIGHPGEDFNCRCVRDFNIPDFVEIQTPDERKMIRKHITNLRDSPDFCIKQVTHYMVIN